MFENIDSRLLKCFYIEQVIDNKGNSVFNIIRKPISILSLALRYLPYKYQESVSLEDAEMKLYEYITDEDLNYSYYLNKMSDKRHLVKFLKKLINIWK